MRMDVRVVEQIKVAKPRLLDLFCGAGGATKGYQEAGFCVVGVDINPQPHYIGDEFYQADAMTYPLEGFDLIHASPPCQSYSVAMRHLATPQPKLIDPLRERLGDLPYIIENVPGAPLRDPLILCGTMFGLRVIRHRLFESPFALVPPGPCQHHRGIMNPHRKESRQRMYEQYGRGCPEKRWATEMGVGWMNRHEARESIPPAYTRYIGEQFLAQLN